MSSGDISEITRSLGAIESSIKNIADQLEKLPCAENSRRLTQIETIVSDREKFDKEKRELEKEFKGETKNGEEKIFKMNAQKISIIALIISIIVGASSISSAIINIYERISK